MMSNKAQERQSERHVTSILLQQHTLVRLQSKPIEVRGEAFHQGDTATDNKQALDCDHTLGWLLPGCMPERKAV